MNHAVTLTRNGNCGLITIASPPVNALGQAVRSGLVEAFLARKHDRARPNGARHDDSRGSTA